MIYYDRKGQPIYDTLKWADMFEHGDRAVGKTTSWHGRLFISTVWLGLDHDFGWREIDTPNPHPIIFETMAFIGGVGFAQERYSTEEEAAAGHKAIVAEFHNPIKVLRALHREGELKRALLGLWKKAHRDELT